METDVRQPVFFATWQTPANLLLILVLAGLTANLILPSVNLRWKVQLRNCPSYFGL